MGLFTWFVPELFGNKVRIAFPIGAVVASVLLLFLVLIKHLLFKRDIFEYIYFEVFFFILVSLQLPSPILKADKLSVSEGKTELAKG